MSGWADLPNDAVYEIYRSCSPLGKYLFSLVDKRCASASRRGPRPYLKPDIVKEAGENGYLSILRAFHADKVPLDNIVFVEAARAGAVDVLQWAEAEKIAYDSYNCIDAAIMAGNFMIVDAYTALGKKIGTDRLLASGIRHGVKQYIAEFRATENSLPDWRRVECYTAMSQLGDLSLIKEYADKLDQKRFRAFLQGAVAGRQRKVLEWLNGNAEHSELFKSYLTPLIGSFFEGVETFERDLTWVTNLGFPLSEDACLNFAKLDLLVRSLQELSPSISSKALEKIISIGDISAVRWALSSCALVHAKRALTAAVSSRSLAIVKEVVAFLGANLKSSDIGEVFITVPHSHSPESAAIMAFLFPLGGDLDLSEALLTSIAEDDVECFKFLLEKRAKYLPSPNEDDFDDDDDDDSDEELKDLGLRADSLTRMCAVKVFKAALEMGWCEWRTPFWKFERSPGFVPFLGWLHAQGARFNVDWNLIEASAVKAKELWTLRAINKLFNRNS